MFQNCKNTKKQGDVGLGVCISHFCSLGYTVSIPLTDSQDYDLVVEFPDIGLQKIQIKTTNSKTNGGKYVVGLRITGGNSRSNFVHKLNTEIFYDQLFVLTSNGDMYLISKDIIKNNKNSISLGENYLQYKI
jgi:hypothetical protein